MKKIILIAASIAAVLPVSYAKAEEQKSTMFNGSTNLQVFYDFGKDRKCATTTVEGFYNDPWGNTFFFIDHDYPTQYHATSAASQSMSGTYWELARCLNFWQNSKLGFMSLHVEYDGGAYRGYPINHSFLTGVDFFVHNSDFSNTFNFKVMYKAIFNQNAFEGGRLPMQFTFVWGMQDIFNCKGLRFSGFADFWGEKHMLYSDNKGEALATPELSRIVFLTEPQLWYSVGQHFGCPNLNIGGEIELSYDFGSSKGFWCRPCLGAKWVF